MKIKGNNKNLGISFHINSDHLNEKHLKNLRKFDSKNIHDIDFVFLIESDRQLSRSLQFIAKYEIRKFRLKPIFNNQNIDFFEKNVYFDSQDFAGIEIKQKEIFANQTLNRNYFGNLCVLADGSIKTSVSDNQALGKIDQDFLSILRKVSQETSNWLLTRNKVKPCENCCFNDLCPPISDYELQIGRYDLCRINK